jgi:chaperonin GroES
MNPKVNLSNFQVIGDKILISPIKIKDENGIYIPDSYEDKAELGRVVKVGSGKLLENGMVIPHKVCEGDIVYFNKYSSVKFRINGEDYFTIREEDVEMYGKDSNE